MQSWTATAQLPDWSIEREREAFKYSLARTEHATAGGLIKSLAPPTLHMAGKYTLSEHYSHFCGFIWQKWSLNNKSQALKYCKCSESEYTRTAAVTTVTMLILNYLTVFLYPIIIELVPKSVLEPNHAKSAWCIHRTILLWDAFVL